MTTSNENDQHAYQHARHHLVKTLMNAGVQDKRVLAAINKVPREAFVLEMTRKQAYDNRALPIAAEQTISQPLIVALMTSYLLSAKHSVKRVLEIGTGSGYQAAVLLELVDEVYSIERIETLAAHAHDVLSHLYPERLAAKQLQLKHGDGYAGWPEAAPFDGIIVTACATEVPSTLVDQLAEGANCVIPIEHNEQQQLLIITREKNRFVETWADLVRFVPLKHGLA